MSRTLLPLLWLVSAMLTTTRTEANEDQTTTVDRYIDEGHQVEYLTQQRMSEVLIPDPCPPVSAEASSSTEACLHQPLCLSSSNCSSNSSCCFNGCVFACLPNVQRPDDAVMIDWLDEANRGPVVFDDSNDEDLEIECSTSGASHSCPERHVCQILEPGDQLRAIPNRGVCVDVDELHAAGGVDGLAMDLTEAGTGRWSESGATSGHHHRHLESVRHFGDCLLTSEQYSGIEEFIKGRHFTSCVCSVGTVLCSVPQQGPTKRRRHSRRRGRCHRQRGRC